MGQFIAPKATTTQRLTITPVQGELVFDTTSNKLYGGDGTTVGGFLIGNGDVSGPSSAVANRVVFFDGTSGKLIKDSGLTLSGTNTGDQTITLTGDVTGSGTGSFAATISASSVTLAKMANLAANSIIGNNTVSAATPIALSGTQVTAMLDVFSSTLNGLAPASGGGTTTYLRADGAWATPPTGTGTVTSITASSPLTGGTITTSGTIGIQAASSLQGGYLTANDWSSMLKITSSLYSGSLSRAGLNARTGTSNSSSDKNLTITVYDEDAIKITTDVSQGPTNIDIAPGFAAGITNTNLKYNGELFLNLTGTATGYSPSVSIQTSDGTDTSYVGLSNNVSIASGGIIDMSASEIRYTDQSTFYHIGIQLPTLTANSTYTLPVSVPTSSKVLQSDSSGVMTWITPNSGTVTSVSALTLGTSGTDLSSTVATGTTTPVITLNVPTASATNRGALSSADWSIFNGKQDALSGTGFVKISGTTISYDNSTYLTANQSISFTASGDTSGTASGATSLSPSITVTGLRGVALPVLGASAGLLKYTGTGTNTWVFDTSTYLTANQTITLSGDISGSGTTAITTTIGANKVTNSMLAQIATATFKGRTTAGTGDVEDLTGTQATAMLNAFSSTLKGLAPASGGGTTNFLRADGTWAAPGGGSGSPGGSNTQIQYNSSGTFAGSANFVWDNTNIRLGIAQSTPTSRFHLNFNQNSVTQADANGILLANSTAAISGTQSISPAIVIQGNGYATTPAASQDVRFRMDVLPTQGTANPGATWQLGSSINGAAYTNLLTYTSAGILSVVNVISVSGGTGLLNASSQIFVGTNSTSPKFYRITNGGGTTTPTALFGAAGGSGASGGLSLSYDATNQLVFLAGNGTNNIPRAGIQITNLTNTAGSETGDLIFLTQSGGTAISEKMRIFAAGNVGINTGSTNGGFKFDVNGTGRYQSTLTSSGRVHATVAKAAAYTLTATDEVIWVTASAGYNITLPTATTGQKYTIVKTDNNANIITIATTGAARINGATTYTGLAAQYKHITVVFDGTNWFITSSN